MRFVAFLLLASIIAVVANTAPSNAGNETLWVDPAGECAGMTPCFITIQEAVRSANPGDTINIFPGEYPEDVNLAHMGLDVGGTRGDITLQAVDAAGSYSPGTAILRPSLSLLGGGFPVDSLITLRGLTVEDAGQAGILLTGAGSALIEDVTVTGSELFGLALYGEDVTIRRSVANANDFGGFGVFVSGSVEITDATANDNTTDDDADGFRITAGGDVTATNLTANDNREEGIDFQAVMGHVALSGCSTFRNGGDAVDVDRGSGLTIDRCTVDESGDDGMEIGEDVSIPTVSITNSSVSGSAEDGIELNVSGPTEVHCVNFVENAFGLRLETSGTVNAEGNWWNSPSGPAHPSNPGGAGDSIHDGANGSSGTVDFTPFLDGPCGGLTWGDLDCDGDVDEDDAMQVIRFLAGLPPLQEPDCPAPEDVLPVEGFGDWMWFDVNCDGLVDGADLIAIVAHIAGLAEPPAADCPAVGEEVNLEED